MRDGMCPYARVKGGVKSIQGGSVRTLVKERPDGLRAFWRRTNLLFDNNPRTIDRWTSFKLFCRVVRPQLSVSLVIVCGSIIAGFMIGRRIDRSISRSVRCWSTSSRSIVVNQASQIHKV